MTEQPRTRYTRRIEAGAFEEKIGFTLHFDQGLEHFLFGRDVARELALKLLRVLELPARGRRPADVSVISEPTREGTPIIDATGPLEA